MLAFALSLFIVVILVPTDCKKYDINAECIRMFGEDVKTVVKRFRSTPAYLKILKTKIDELRQHVGDVLLQEYSWHHDKELVEKIKAKFPAEAPTTCPPMKKGNDRRFHHNKELRINQDMDNTIDTTDNITKTEPSTTQNARRIEEKTTKGNNTTVTTQRQHEHKPTLRRRDNKGEHEVISTISQVIIMDQYKLDGNMTVDDINEAKNIAFEVMGDVIHSTIKDITDPEDDLSTKHPGGGGHHTAKTTTHVEKHTVGEDSDEKETTAKNRGKRSKMHKDET